MNHPLSGRGSLLSRLVTLAATMAIHAAWLLSLGSTWAASPPSDQRPNVIFIIVDDSEFSEYGCYGGKVLTPHIDSLAKDGVLFRRGFTSSSVCTPTRYTCISGRYAGRATYAVQETRGKVPTYIHWNAYLEPDRPNIASVLRAGGYTTGMVGKWHMGETEELLQFLATQPSPLPKNVKEKADIRDPAVATFIRNLYAVQTNTIRTNFGFDFVGSLYQANVNDPRTLWTTQCGLGVHNQEWITQGALQFIDQAVTKGKPFFLYLGTTLFHDPSPLESLKTADIGITQQGLLDEPPNVQPSRESVFQRVRAAGLPETAAPSTWLDDGIGAILAKLDRLGIADNTVVFFFSDQQSPGKTTCNHNGVNTPLLMRWKAKIKPGQTIDVLVSNVDFAPTILGLCGVKPPPDMSQDGRDIMPLFADGGAARWRDALFFELGPFRAVRTADWKYIARREVTRKELVSLGITEPLDQKSRSRLAPNTESMGRGIVNRKAPKDQLYDLKNDPGEKNNLADDTKYARQLAEMKTRLTEWLRTMPGPFGEFKP